MEPENNQTINLEQLPFRVERKNNHLELTAKPRKKLSGKKLEEFKANKIKVELYLFKQKDLENLSRIVPVDYSKETTIFTRIGRTIKNSFLQIILSDK